MTDALKEKVAIVTGGGRGIGRGVARFLAQEGARLVVNDFGANLDGTGRSPSPADEAVAEIRAEGGEAVANYDSVVEFRAGEAVVQQALDSFGRLDVVVTCAGILRDRMVFNMTEEEWDDVISIHLKGTFNVARHACVVFRQQRSGRIITFTSESGLLGNTGQANYGAAQVGHRWVHQSGGPGHGALRCHLQLHRSPSPHAHDGLCSGVGQEETGAAGHRWG